MNHRFGEDAYNSTAAAAQRLEKGAEEISAGVQREAKKWLSQLEQQIIQNPALALGVAVAVGITLGMMWKRD
jgi:ElaB/YqjD/DUF883 family membrane-anchored ribosome-binding protein